MPAHRKSLNQGTSFRPQKRLGQHFLSDRGAIKEIVERSGLVPSDAVLEVGPGMGAITLPTARRVRRLVAVEKDARLAEILEKKLIRAGIDNVELINEDILKFDFGRVVAGGSERMQVIGNLPYNISSPFLEKLVENREKTARAVLMLQLELAKRLTAEPGGKDYGALTVWVRYHAAASVLRKVPKEAFYPRPKVDSMVLKLDFLRPFPDRASDDRWFKHVVKAAFAHRRKTLLNSLSASLGDRDALAEALDRCGIDPRRRAETLGMDEYLRLTSALSGRLGSRSSRSRVLTDKADQW